MFINPMSNIYKKFRANTWRRYTPFEKLELVLKNITGVATIKNIVQETGVDTKTFRTWKKQFFNKAHEAFNPSKPLKQQQSEKDKIINRQEKEIQLLKKLLEHYKKIQTIPSSRSPDSS